MKLTKTGIFKKISNAEHKKWTLLPDNSVVRRKISKALSLSDITARILTNRLPEPSVEAARDFINPVLTSLYQPWQLKSMDKAVARLVKAINAGEKIVVFGDYDSDGVTASALLLKVFKALGNPIESYLPHRVEDGYGISESFVRKMQRSEVRVVITVDCGVSNYTEVMALQNSGVDVIVTDHHEPGDADLPQALAIINPKRHDSSYPFRELAGVGIAFKLAWALCEKISGSEKVLPGLRQVLLEVLPYVALGTIADMAPLIDENRIYAHCGLKQLEKTKVPGLQALLKISNLGRGKIKPRDVSFRLGPRINAAGRMHSAALALELLIAEESSEATGKAIELDNENNKRQELCQELYGQARKYVAENIELEQSVALVVIGRGWHEGVIGIVASRLVEEFKRPSVVIALSEDGSQGKGSARSVPGFHLYQALSYSRSRFQSFGGHEMAAGFSLGCDQLDAFCQEFQVECRRQVMLGGMDPELTIDGDIHFRQITDEFARELQLLAPFGCGNASPLFLTRHIKVAGKPQAMGKQNKHFSFFASQDRIAFRAVVFNHIDWLKRIEAGTGYWDIVFELVLNDYYTPARVELRIKDMRAS